MARELTFYYDVEEMLRKHNAKAICIHWEDLQLMEFPGAKGY